VDIEEKNVLAVGSETLRVEAEALKDASLRLDHTFVDAVKVLLECKGKVVCTGLGKSGHIASKIAATLASTGSPSFFLHPTEALHGDLGMIAETDCLVAVAYGGETMEVNEVARHSRLRQIPLISITGNTGSSLAKLSDVVIDGSVANEACPLNLAPTSSSTLALALGDALAMALMKAKGFVTQDFAQFHPGGSIGRKFVMVSDLMRPIESLSKVTLSDGFNQVMEAITNPNFGIIPVLDENGRLKGAITDGDIRRALTEFQGDAIHKNAQQLMSSSPKTIDGSDFAVNAFKRMQENNITALFVADDSIPTKPIGLIRLQDLLEKKIG